MRLYIWQWIFNITPKVCTARQNKMLNEMALKFKTASKDALRKMK